MSAPDRTAAPLGSSLDGIDRVGRLVLVLMDLDGHSAARAAELLGLPLDLVREHHRQARGQLGLSAPSSTCRGWMLVSRWDALSVGEREAGSRHLALCRPCRDEQEAQGAVRRRLAVVLPLAAAGTGLGGLLALIPSWVAPVAVAIGAGAGALALGAGLGLGGSSGAEDRALAPRSGWPGIERQDATHPPLPAATPHVPGGPPAGPAASREGEPVAVGPWAPTTSPPLAGDLGIAAAGLPVGHLLLTDNAAGVAAFSVANMVPGDAASRSITVTNGGTLPFDVRLYGSRVTGNGLAEHVLLRIGTAPGRADLFDGTLAQFASTRTSYARGTAPLRLAPDGAQTYYFWTQLAEHTPASFQNGSAAADFVWQAEAP